MNLATLMACAVCGHTLTEDHDADGHTTYQHPVSEDSRSHRPVAINAALVPDLFHRCHLCSGPHPVWNYRTGLLEAESIGATRELVQTYNTQWHACFQCAQWIEADDLDALTAHCTAVMGWKPHGPEHALLYLIHQAVITTRERRTLLATTDWPPARIDPEMLPKIRDRFTQLLRSNDNLPDKINNPGERRRLATELDHTPLYWINSEFTDRINQVTTSQPPAWINDDLIPTPNGLLAWAAPVGPAQMLGAVSWTTDNDGTDIIGYRTIGNGAEPKLMPALRHELGWLTPIHTEHIPHGTAIDGHHPLGPLTTTWLQISQQLTDTTRARLPKSITRQYHRANRPTPEVKIVQIRPRPTQPSEPPATGTDHRTRAKPDYRYWVSGHPRNQAYGPGRALRRRIDIQPYLKGDEELPIKLSTTVRTLGKKDTE